MNFALAPPLSNSFDEKLNLIGISKSYQCNVNLSKRNFKFYHQTQFTQPFLIKIKTVGKGSPLGEFERKSPADGQMRKGEANSK